MMAAKVAGTGIPMKVFHDPSDFDPARMAKLVFVTEKADAAERAIGVGDNWNDAEMFDVCGTSVAMGNATLGVQALADQVTTAIDDDGLHNAFVANGLI